MESSSWWSTANLLPVRRLQERLREELSWSLGEQSYLHGPEEPRRKATIGEHE